MRLRAACPAAAPDEMTMPCICIETHLRLHHERDLQGRCNEIILGRRRSLTWTMPAAPQAVLMMGGNIRGDLITMQRDAMPGDLPRETGS
jgi:hypothetical protein